MALNTPWDISETKRSYITDQRETQLMSVRAQSKQRLHNQGLMVVLKLVVDYSNT